MSMECGAAEKRLGMERRDSGQHNGGSTAAQKSEKGGKRERWLGNTTAAAAVHCSCNQRKKVPPLLLHLPDIHLARESTKKPGGRGGNNIGTPLQEGRGRRAILVAPLPSSLELI